MTVDRKKATRYPLHVTIAAAFTALLLVVGVALISFNFYESRKIALLGADDLLERSSAHVHSDIQKLYKPAQNLVDVSSKVLTAHDEDLEGRLEDLAFLAEPFHMSSTISSIFVAYENGDFFLVRSLRDDLQRETLGAPPRATLAVQSIESRAEMNPRQQLLFFDEDLVLLEQRPVDWTGFDPRERAWYAQAMGTAQPITSEFYVFFTTREVGITFARQLDDGGAVVGVDVALGDLERGLARLRVTPSSKIAILDGTGSVIALSDTEREVPLVADRNESIDMPNLSSLEDPVYHRLGELFDSGVPTGRQSLEVAGRTWLASFSKLPTRRNDIYLAVLIPRDELLADVIRVRNYSVLISIGLLIAAVTVVIGISRHISGSLQALSREARSIRDFKLDTPITVHSRIREVDDLAATMGVMKSSIQEFLAISRAMSGEKDYRRLLGMILAEARNVSRADAGAILLRSDDDMRLQVAILERRGNTVVDDGASQDGRFAPVELEAEIDAGGAGIDRYVAAEGKTVHIDDLAAERRFDFRAFKARFDGDGLETASALCVPLRDQLGEVIGMLQLVKFADRVEVGGNDNPGFSPEIIPYIEALSSSAAVAIDVRRLLKAQRDLLDSLVLMIAGAIDAKSPYTHGHCRRVPVIARMLAEAAHASDGGPFTEFELSEDEWYELHLSSWLHDCGKVTTPEYVVDKATKLETIYNRIHEIRTRFEVLWRDAELDYHKARSESGANDEQLRERLERRHEEIRSDFEFVAECNLGDRPMTPERIERLRQVADQRWARHLDDSPGLSHLELQARGGASEAELPVVEPLLADRPEHIVPRAEGARFGDGADDIRMEVPENLYNRGELYNLCISRGTLTAEERFKINEHVIQSIRMLRNLPFPRELRRVPDWAGNHHEKLDGTGYPRRLSAAQLSIPERVMAVADIFEALTAADRPYHAPKTLSKTVAIMSSMCTGGHICPDLFVLMLESGVYLDYAKQYMKPEQIDDVDVAAIVSSLRATAEHPARS